MTKGFKFCIESVWRHDIQPTLRTVLLLSLLGKTVTSTISVFPQCSKNYMGSNKWSFSYVCPYAKSCSVCSVIYHKTMGVILILAGLSKRKVSRSRLSKRYFITEIIDSLELIFTDAIKLIFFGALE